MTRSDIRPHHINVQKVTITHPLRLASGESTIGTTRIITHKGGMEIVEKALYLKPPSAAFRRMFRKKHQKI